MTTVYALDEKMELKSICKVIFMLQEAGFIVTNYSLSLDPDITYVYMKNQHQKNGENPICFVIDENKIKFIGFNPKEAYLYYESILDIINNEKLKPQDEGSK